VTISFSRVSLFHGVGWLVGWLVSSVIECSVCTVGIFLFTTASRPALGPTQPPIQWVPGALYLGLKRPGSEADHLPPSSAGVKNVWSYAPTPQYAFVVWCSVKAQGQLYTSIVSICP
jgi:hypothetical protein